MEKKESEGIVLGRTMLKDIIEQLLAIELLEYHNKGFLAGDNCTRCELKQEYLARCLDILKRFEL